MLASWIGPGSILGNAGKTYETGMAALMLPIGSILGIILLTRIAGKVRSYEKYTVPEIIGDRYGPVARNLSVFALVMAYMVIVSYQYNAGGAVLYTILADNTGTSIISIELATIIAAVFIIAYTMLAGLLSVAYTDAANSIIMTLVLIISLPILWIKAGSWSGMETAFAAMNKSQHMQFGGVYSAMDIINFCLPPFLLVIGDANMYQRIFSAQDGGSAKKAVFFWIIGVVVLESVISMLGLTGAVAASKGIIPDLVAQAQAGVTDPTASAMLEARQAGSESVIPAIARYAGLPMVLGLLLVSTMMAIIVSTADSFLLIPATNLTRDVYLRYINSAATDKQVLLISRSLVLVLGIIAFLLVSQFKTVLNAAFTAYNIYGTSITPALLAAFLWKRATKEGAIASILTGATVTIVWTYFLPSWEGFSTLNPFLQELTYPAAGLSVSALVIGSLLTSAPPPESLEQFFNDGD